eukprot:2024666-Prymnesium_polylepis.1
MSRGPITHTSHPIRKVSTQADQQRTNATAVSSEGGMGHAANSQQKYTTEGRTGQGQGKTERTGEAARYCSRSPDPVLGSTSRKGAPAPAWSGFPAAMDLKHWSGARS